MGETFEKIQSIANEAEDEIRHGFYKSAIGKLKRIDKIVSAGNGVKTLCDDIQTYKGKYGVSQIEGYLEHLKDRYPNL